MSSDSFKNEVYRMVASIPRGRVSTYKEVARAVGRPTAARAVGSVLHHNTDFEHVPCHRVVKSNGQIGGYVKGVKHKISLLKAEGVEVKGYKVDLSIYFFSFDKRNKDSH